MRTTLATLFALIVTVATAQKATKPMVVVSWDGAADWVMDRMLAKGKLRNVAKLANAGANADYCIPPFPSKTAVSHFSIFSGTSPDKSFITGNSVPILPKAEHTLLETQSGFDARWHATEPLWVTAAKAGKNVVALSAAGSYPPSNDQELLRAKPGAINRYREFSGFESDNVIAPARIFTEKDLAADRTITFKVGEQTFLARLIDDPRDPVIGFDSVSITGPRQSKSYTLKPRAAEDKLIGWSGPTSVTKGDLTASVYFRLFSLSPDGSHLMLYQRKATAIKGTESAEVNREYEEAYGGFHDDPFFDVYQKGLLGSQLYRGGEGAAEARCLEIVRLDMSFLKRSFRYALEKWNPDLIFHYSPMSDSAGHTWMGMLDPRSANYNEGLAAKLLPYYEKVLELQDDWLGDMMEAAGKRATFCLVSDHGMTGISKSVNVNVILEKAGLCARDSNNRLDLAKTCICAPPWGDFFLVVNTTDWKSGIIAPANRKETVEKAKKALLDARDPETGMPIITKVFTPDEMGANSGLGGPTGGDLYLDFAPGYYPRNRFADSTVTSSGPNGSGEHGFWPLREEMHSIFYIAGPGVQPGLTVPAMRTVDIAPTLCRLLGIPIPAGVDGHVIGELIRR